jgi:hypothetical protein
MTGGLELHHIWGRISSSVLNSAPLCKLCHVHVLHTQGEHLKLFGKTMSYLIKEKYKLNNVDNRFLEMVGSDLIHLSTYYTHNNKVTPQISDIM